MEAADKMQSRKCLFGGSKPWNTHDWTSSDDRVRGGSSISHLYLCSPSSSSTATTTTAAALFTGTLDTQTLGGAGFASQRTTAASLALDLHAYTGGLELDIARADGRIYTLILKDQVPSELPSPNPSSSSSSLSESKKLARDESSTLSWEADFTPRKEAAGGKGQKMCLPWKQFKPMYRGREKEGAGELDRGAIKRVAIMCRSFFGSQEGDFELVIRSIAAVKEGERDEEEEKGEEKAKESEQAQYTPYRDDPDPDPEPQPQAADPTADHGDEQGGFEKKKNSTAPPAARQGWLKWIFSTCA